MKQSTNLAQKILTQDRRALSKAITLVESNRPEDREQALSLLDELMPYADKAVRIGITGSPGVGKSTFIEAYGQHLISAGQRIAALAVDPSSKLTGGSILGDKTRMPTLANEKNAYIRPTPSGSLLGGVARRSREVIAVCAAAGFDTILIETVGVGQSETDVANMTDCHLLLLQPASGDTLQGIKRGIMELADIVVVNKADGALLPAARESAAHYMRALAFMPDRMTDWHCPVILCSALKKEKFDEIDEKIKAYLKLAHENGGFIEKREKQTLDWLKDETQATLLDQFWRDDTIQKKYTMLEHAIAKGASPARIADKFVHNILNTGEK